MILAFLGLISSAVDECPALPNGIVISKYYLKNCSACKRLSPVLEELKSKIEKAAIDVKLREIECTDCECTGIDSFPTLEITKDKESKGKSVGFKDYQNLSSWIVNSLNIDAEIFNNHIEHDHGTVKALVSKDFLSGFDGQWLILFYEDHNDKNRELFKTMSKKFKDKLSVGEVHSKESESVTARYNITEYPFIMAINHGTSVPYSGNQDLESISEFAEKLYRPSFENTTYSQLKHKAGNLKNGEPLYVVLYRDFEAASLYFNEIAQQFKFKATILSSNDPEMFEASGFYPKDASEHDPNKLIQLFVYKNGSFFQCPVPLENTEEIIQWIFHTHFAHVTNISNENFYTVFHGLKPVILLLTHSEMLLDEFNKLSADRHLGSPSSNMVYAALDTQTYPLFKKHVLTDIKEPSIMFFDPVRQQWYYANKNLNKKNFHKVSLELIESYFSKKLPQYPQKKSKYGFYTVMAFVIVAIAFVGRLIATRKKMD